MNPLVRNQGQQVRAALRSAIVDGLIGAGTKLPSSRSLAEQIGVRRNAIVAAYEYLISDGLVEARHGSGTFVAARLPAPAMIVPTAKFAVDGLQRRPFALGHTLIDPVVLRRLANAARRRIASAAADKLGYGDPRGSEHLRVQIARHLAAHRGIRCDPGCIMVVNGMQHGLRLCIEALLSPGDKVWMEDPGYYAARNTLTSTGMHIVPVPVDAEGIVAAAPRRNSGSAQAVYVTPSHQFPTGVTMSMTRRVALIAWARLTKAWILEDDYDSEFRYAGPPLTALAGIGSECVIYFGTFTKTLFAGLRLAYAVVPPAALERVLLARATHDRFPAVFLQDAVADLMSDGTFDAHTRRMRKRYREARDSLAAALENAAGASLRVVKPTQGLHLLALLPPGASKGSAHCIREAAGVEAKLLSEMRMVHRAPDGLILGFSGHDVTEIRLAARRLGQAVRQLCG